MGILERALAHWPILESTWEGGPRTDIHPKPGKLPGSLSRMTPNTFNSNAKTFGSLMLGPILRRNGFIHARVVQSRGRRGSRFLYGIRLTPLLCSVSGWKESSWVDNSLRGEPNARENESSWVDNSWKGRSSGPKKESWVDQSWASNASKTQASTPTNQSASYFEGEEAYDDDTYNDGTYDDDNEDNSYAMQSWLSPTPSYNQVPRPESLWQPHFLVQYENQLEAVQHLGTFGMKAPYRFGTHERDPLAQEYRRLDPNLLVIASSLMSGQREGHQFLSQHHASVVSRTNVCIYLSMICVTLSA